MTDIKSMTMEELTHTLREMGQPAFRGGQVNAHHGFLTGLVRREA